MAALITSSGGHVYDRTTGTWEGATQGSVGDGKDHGIQGPGKVWHDANGISGIEVFRPAAQSGGSDRGGSGPGAAQVTSNGTSATVAAGSGPGAPAVKQGGSAAGGAGPGSSMVVMGPDMTVLTPEDKPLKRIGIGTAQESLGGISDIGWIKTTNGWMVTPSSDAKERIEDDIIQQLGWAWRNQVAPYMGLTPIPVPDWIGNTDNYDYDWVTLEIKPKPGTVSIGGGF